MKLTPRKDEIAAVVEVLEDPGHTSAEAMAKAAIKVVAEMLSQREWWLYAWRDGPGPVLVWGPLSSEKDVESFARKVGLQGEHRAVQAFSTSALLDRIDKADKGILRYCTSCGHPVGAHQHDKMSGICAVKGCGCRVLGKEKA